MAWTVAQEWAQAQEMNLFAVAPMAEPPGSKLEAASGDGAYYPAEFLSHELNMNELSVYINKCLSALCNHSIQTLLIVRH